MFQATNMELKLSSRDQQILLSAPQDLLLRAATSANGRYTSHCAAIGCKLAAHSYKTFHEEGTFLLPIIGVLI